MKCAKCGYEMPELTMYCPQCGTAQYGAKEHEVTLELSDPMKSSVTITGYTNLTNALTTLKSITGLEMRDVRAILNELPYTILKNVTAEKAELMSADLLASGIMNVVEGTGEVKETVQEEPVQEEAPVETEEPVQEETAVEDTKEPTFEEQMDAFLKEDKPEEKPEAEKHITDEEFEAQMAAFLNGDQK